MAKKAHGHIVSVLLTKKQYTALRTFTRREHRAISSYVRHLIVTDLLERGFDADDPLEDEDDESEAIPA